jgi:hypothetical protein
MMMFTAMVLCAIWLLGVANGSTWGGAIHLLLTAAVAVLLIRFVRGRLASDGAPSNKGSRERARLPARADGR